MAIHKYIHRAAVFFAWHVLPVVLYPFVLAAMLIQAPYLIVWEAWMRRYRWNTPGVADRMAGGKSRVAASD
jgi:hypothetical protein